MNRKLQKILISLFKGNTSEGIDMYLHKDNQVSFYKVKIKKKGEIKKQDQFHCSIDEISSHFKSLQSATYLSIRGDVVIHKKSHSKTENTSKAVKQALPGINPDHYKIQMFSDNNGKYFSIIPKETYQNLLDKTNRLVVDIVLGPFSIQTVSDISIPWQDIERNSGEITITRSGKEPEVYEKIHYNNKEVDNRFILAYANALQHFDDNQNPKSLNKSGFSNFIYEKILKFLLLYGLGFVFLILLGSTFYRSNLQEKYKLLMSETAAINSQLSILESKHSGLDEKHQFIESQKLLNKSKCSKYVDRILACIPKKIKLNEILVNPIKKEDKNIIEYNNNSLRIHGITNQSILVNEWNEEIKTLDFVESAQVSLIDMKSKNSFEFTIEVKLKNV